MRGLSHFLSGNCVTTWTRLPVSLLLICLSLWTVEKPLLSHLYADQGLGITPGCEHSVPQLAHPASFPNILISTFLWTTEMGSSNLPTFSSHILVGRWIVQCFLFLSQFCLNNKTVTENLIKKNFQCVSGLVHISYTPKFFGMNLIHHFQVLSWLHILHLLKKTYSFS